MNKVLMLLPEKIRLELDEVRSFLIEYVRNPIQRIRQAPDWDWRTLLLVQICLAAITGILQGLIGGGIGQALFGLIFLPISTVVITYLLSLGFSFGFEMLFKQSFTIKPVYTIILLATPAYFSTMIFSNVVPLLQLVGFAIAGLLLTVGFSENFNIERNKVLKIVGGMFAVIAIFFVVKFIQMSQQTGKFKESITTESMDILKKDFGQ